MDAYTAVDDPLDEGYMTRMFKPKGLAEEKLKEIYINAENEEVLIKYQEEATIYELNYIDQL